MSPGPKKSFDPQIALEEARDVFWRLGYEGTGIRDLEESLGIGRKSLYDTFGSKRELFERAIEQYADTVIQRMCDGLQRRGTSAFGNLERVLGNLAKHHGAPGSLGCLLGVAMGQAASDDEPLAALLRSVLGRLERGFEALLRQAQVDGDVRADLRPKDTARQLVAVTQGMALMGRVAQSPAGARSVIRASLLSLRPSPAAPSA